MLQIAFVLLMTIQTTAPPVTPGAPQNEIKDALAHAEALYYGARFSEAIALLSRVDEALKTQPGRTPEKINTKLKLALAHIGLNDTVKAKTLLMELYALDSDYALDAAQFSPKVMTVASDAKAEQAKAACFTAQTDARSFLESGKAKEFLDLMRSQKSKCSALVALQPEAADSFYKTGVAAYRRNEFSTARSNFEATLALAPEHELALQYMDLIQSKQQLSEDRLLLQWQRNFDTRQLSAAATDYRQIMSSSNSHTTAAVNHVNDQYRKALSDLVQKFNQTCPNGDVATMNAIRTQISEILPEPSFGADIRKQMVVCPDPVKTVANVVPDVKADAPAVPAVKPPDAAPASSVCFDMQSQLVLTRLKTRVDPVISADIRYYLKTNAQLTVRVKSRISESGEVTVMGIQDGNPILNAAIKTAVAQWKFNPIRDSTGPRCVDTEIPIVIKLSQ